MARIKKTPPVVPPNAAEPPPTHINEDAQPIPTMLMVPGHHLFPADVMMQAPDRTLVRVKAVRCECDAAFPLEPEIPLARLHLLEHALGQLMQALTSATEAGADD